MRHPIGSGHEPWSVAGGTILVKLRQMADRGERRRTLVDAASWRREHPGAAPAVHCSRQWAGASEALLLPAGACAIELCLAPEDLCWKETVKSPIMLVLQSLQC